MSLALALATLPLLTVSSAQPHTRNAKTISFQPCPELNNNFTALYAPAGLTTTTFDCAKLSVPRDYTSPLADTIDLNLFRVNATQQPALGTVLINFGGPGGTGAENLPLFAKEAQANIGSQWNIVSWDPRGTGFTLPFKCNLDAVFGSVSTPPQKRDIGPLASANATEAFVNVGWDAAGLIADSCSQQATDDSGTLIGTAFTARDMIQIVDALGEDGLLRYYGWSYGTALGSYVAAMFPERVERMVLDANLSPYEYQSGTYTNFVTDADAALEGFWQACFDAEEACDLYTVVQPNAPQDIVDAVNVLLAPIAQNATSSFEAYSLLTLGKLSFMTPGAGLYSPKAWPGLATTLATVLKDPLAAAAAPPPSSGPTWRYGLADATSAYGIRGSDATFHANSSDEYLPVVRQQATVSRSFSDMIYLNLWASARWNMTAKERYWGDFRVKTKSPILYINGEHDPVTPLKAAYNGSAAFEGSAVLPHSGYGHGIFEHPSKCVAGHVQTYFQDGTLPSEGSRCEPDMTVLELWKATVEGAGAGAGNGSAPSNSSLPGNSSTPGGNGSAPITANGASQGAVGGKVMFVTVLVTATMAIMNVS